MVVYTRTGKVLLLRRADHPEFWQSVTGSMEWGDEQPAETAARELREETGITVAPAAFTDWKVQNRYVIFPQWRYKYAPGVTENTEHFFLPRTAGRANRHAQSGRAFRICLGVDCRGGRARVLLDQPRCTVVADERTRCAPGPAACLIPAPGWTAARAWCW